MQHMVFELMFPNSLLKRLVPFRMSIGGKDESFSTLHMKVINVLIFKCFCLYEEDLSTSTDRALSI